jgi:Fe-S-cluster containining protein
VREDDAPPGPGPLEAGLDALWDLHRSRWRRLLSPRMVRELTLRASFDVDLIAPRRIANTIPKGTIPDCEACPNVCCAGLENVVSLRLRDVAQLIDLGRTDLMTKQKPNFPRWMLTQRPYLAELVASTLWRALPVMRQVGDMHVCVALGRDMKCTLYPRWPTSCERFPYTLSAARRQVHWGTRCPVKKQDPAYEARSEALFQASISAYNERVRDAVLLAHAPKALDELGLGAWITKPDEDPFEPNASALEIIE